MKFNLKKIVIYFLLVLVVNVVVQYVWILVFQGPEFNFGLAFTTAMTISIALVLTMPDK
ncbi:MAG: hypothetical protein L3J41_02270 [Melioribacteraceae bacterium]|nr:hypothetical protein [Melioribacteraceae bacterium]